MVNYFGFIDETGVLHNDKEQRFFAIGLMKCGDTSAFYEELRIIKNRAESQLDLHKKNKGIKDRKGIFEFKFTNITKSTYKFYYDLIDLYFKFPKLQFCCLVIDKQNPKIRIEEIFPNTWDAYIGYSKLLIKNNTKKDDKICIIADFLGKPKASDRYYSTEIKMLPNVYNATVIESHASLFVQVVDVLIGCVVLDFKKNRQPEKKYDKYKANVSEFLKKVIRVDTMAKKFTIFEPNYFNVWEFKP